jgi:hypothetical protein
MDQPLRLHANIGGGGRMVPLVDAVTGEPLAWVPPGVMPERIMVAGASFEQRNRGDAIELSNGARDGSGATVRYASRGAPAGRNALRHLARGLGFSDDTLVLRDDMYHHFGGALFGRLLQLGGIKSGPLRSQSDPRDLAGQDLEALAAGAWQDLEGLCGFGPFQRELPVSVRREAVVRTVAAHRFGEWLQRMRLATNASAEQGGILDEA